MRAPASITMLIPLLLLAGCGTSVRPDLGHVVATPRRADPVTEYPTPSPADTAVDAGTCSLLAGLSRDRPAVHRRIARACEPTAHGGVVVVSRQLVRSAGHRPPRSDPHGSATGQAGQG